MSIQLKPATTNDFEDYFSIRCGESDIFWMGYDGPPARVPMRAVFMNRLGDSPLERPGDKRIYMINADGRNVGFIQMTLNDDGLEFGYSVLDQERGRGYGSAGIKQAVKIAYQYSSHCIAHIRDDNIAPQKAMMHAGLIPTEEVEMKFFPKTGMVGYRKYVL